MIAKKLQECNLTLTSLQSQAPGASAVLAECELRGGNIRRSVCSTSAQAAKALFVILARV